MAKRSKVIEKDKGFNNIKRKIRRLGSYKTAVGFPSTADYKDGTSVALIATVHEYGADIEVTPKMRAFLHYKGLHLKKSTKYIRIPQRSFFRSTLNNNVLQIRKAKEQSFKLMVEGSLSEEQAISQVGEKLVGMIQEKITTLSSPPNSDFTQSQKGSSNPLVDEGTMRSSVKHWEFKL